MGWRTPEKSRWETEPEMGGQRQEVGEELVPGTVGPPNLRSSGRANLRGTWDRAGIPGEAGGLPAVRIPVSFETLAFVS